MKDVRNIVLGSLALIGIAVASYRAYELKKLGNVVREETIIEIEPEKVEISRK